MEKLNGTLQYQMSNGKWTDCEDRTEEFLNECVKNDYHEYTMGQVIDILNNGGIVRNDIADWYANCRIKPDPVHVPKIREFVPDSEPWGY